MHLHLLRNNLLYHNHITYVRTAIADEMVYEVHQPKIRQQISNLLTAEFLVLEVGFYLP